MSERTLQRRLLAEGQTFRRVLDDMRSEVAQRSLAAGKRNVTEHAHLLGFEDSDSFYRSFRRWTGTTPESYRKAVNEQARAGPARSLEYYPGDIDGLILPG